MQLLKVLTKATLKLLVISQILGIYVPKSSKNPPSDKGHEPKFNKGGIIPFEGPVFGELLPFERRLSLRAVV
jgi:hypothetical protein